MSWVRDSIRAFLDQGDRLLLGLCVTATVFGIVVISSATAYMGAERFVLIQTVAMFLGIVLYIILTLIDIDIVAFLMDPETTLKKALGNK